jgi:hypothetical protein
MRLAATLGRARVHSGGWIVLAAWALGCAASNFGCGQADVAAPMTAMTSGGALGRASLPIIGGALDEATSGVVGLALDLGTRVAGHCSGTVDREAFSTVGSTDGV